MNEQIESVQLRLERVAMANIDFTGKHRNTFFVISMKDATMLYKECKDIFAVQDLDVSTYDKFWNLGVKFMGLRVCRSQDLKNREIIIG